LVSAGNHIFYPSNLGVSSFDFPRPKLLAVKVVLKAPAFKAPCKAPAAPASLCISVTLSFWP
jgi:hypothetical protein